MGTLSKTLMAGTLGGTVGSLIAPPGEKRRGFALGAAAGIGGKVLLTHPSVRKALQIDEWQQATGTATKAGKTVTDAQKTVSKAVDQAFLQKSDELKKTLKAYQQELEDSAKRLTSKVPETKTLRQPTVHRKIKLTPATSYEGTSKAFPGININVPVNVQNLNNSTLAGAASKDLANKKYIQTGSGLFVPKT